MASDGIKMSLMHKYGGIFLKNFKYTFCTGEEEWTQLLELKIPLLLNFAQCRSAILAFFFICYGLTFHVRHLKLCYQYVLD
jgi:hypothetical protein